MDSLNGLGDTAADVVIDFNSIDQGFHVLGPIGTGLNVEFANLTITGAVGDSNVKGGAFDLEYVNLIAENIVLTNNSTSGSGSAAFGGYEAQVRLEKSLIYNQSGGQGAVAKIQNGAFYSLFSTFHNLDADITGADSSIIWVDGCASYTGQVLDCKVRLDRTTVSTTQSDNLMGSITGAGLDFIGCGNLFYGNSVDNAAVCDMADSTGTGTGYYMADSGNPIDLTCADNPGDLSAGAINLAASPTYADSLYSSNVENIQYLKIDQASDAIDTIPISTCECGGVDSVDGDNDSISACDVGAFEFVPRSDLGDNIWNDINGNSIQDDGAANGYNGLSVSLYVDQDDDGIAEPDSDDLAAIVSDVTSDDIALEPGYYLFENIAPVFVNDSPASYFVVFTKPSGYDFVTKDSGVDESIDSDVLTNGISDLFNIVPGESDMDLDAGIVETPTVTPTPTPTPSPTPRQGGGGGGGGGGGSNPTPTPTSSTSCVQPFPDIDCAHTFFTYISNLKTGGIVNGYSDGTYRPDSNVSRGEMATFIVRAFKLTTSDLETKRGNSYFNDSIEGVHKDNIIILADLGIVGGYSDKTYRPDVAVNREQISKFIFNAMKVKYPAIQEVDTTFGDIDSMNLFRGYIGYLQQNQIVGGYADGRYGPTDQLTRGQMAKIIDIARNK